MTYYSDLGALLTWGDRRTIYGTVAPKAGMPVYATRFQADTGIGLKVGMLDPTGQWQWTSVGKWRKKVAAPTVPAPRAGKAIAPQTTSTPKPVSTVHHPLAEKEPRKRSDRKPLSARAQCQATGMPSEFVGACSTLLAEGLSIEAVVAQLQPADMQYGEQPVNTTVALPEKSNRKYYIMGGVAAAGLVAYLLLRKKKRS